jgi:hypothetical protein
MAKYLSMTSTTVPAATLQELEAQLSWDAQAAEALKLLDKYGGNVKAAVGEISQQCQVGTKTLLTAIEQIGNKFIPPVKQAAIEELPVLVRKMAPEVVQSVLLLNAAGADGGDITISDHPVHLSTSEAALISFLAVVIVKTAISSR